MKNEEYRVSKKKRLAVPTSFASHFLLLTSLKEQSDLGQAPSFQRGAEIGIERNQYLSPSAMPEKCLYQPLTSQTMLKKPPKDWICCSRIS